MRIRVVLTASTLFWVGIGCTPARYLELKVPGTAPTNHYECKRRAGDKEGAPLECSEVGATSLAEHDHTTHVANMPTCPIHRIRIENAETDSPTVRVICMQVGN